MAQMSSQNELLKFEQVLGFTIQADAWVDFSLQGPYFPGIKMLLKSCLCFMKIHQMVCSVSQVREDVHNTNTVSKT